MASIHHSVDRVRIRPGNDPRAPARARRLARIAHELLGDTLERALAGVEKDIVIERLTVTFPVDPDELDDEAVAWLWASLVRESVERARPPARAELADEDGQVGPTADAVHAGAAVGWADGRPDEAVRVEASTALLRWARDGTRPPESRLEALRQRADLLAHALDGIAEPWRTVIRERLLRNITPAKAPAGPHATGTGRSAVTPSENKGPSVDTSAAEPAPRADPATRLGRGDPAAVPSDDSLAGRRSVPPGAAPTPVSRYGGLVLLHYRLRDLLVRAVADEPDGDEVDVRSTLLALVVGEEGAGDDPLVRLLAGDPEWGVPTELPPHRWRDPTAAREHAEGVLHAFVGDLPGFEASTAAFVREQWLRRGALLIEDRSAVLLTLERRPLDLLLDRLPYPIGALRLPWTPPVFVGWERR